MRVAYKGFAVGKKGLPEARLGAGITEYEVGKWYDNPEAKTASTGFHCCENPLECLSYYSYNKSNTFYAVEVGGDVDEDADHRISCTRIRLLKKLDTHSFLLAAVRYIVSHPKIACNKVYPNKASTSARDIFIFVRGKNPVGAGKKGDHVVLLQEAADDVSIKAVQLIYIDGKKYAPMVYYNIDREAV